MSEQDPKKITKKVDKFIMGALIGGAIGSVLGLTFAPKKGKETRDILMKKGEDLIHKSKDASDQFMLEHGAEIENIKKKAVKESRSFLARLKEKFQKSKERVAEELKKIPTELD